MRASAIVSQEGCSRKTPFFTILLSLTTIYCRFVIGHRTQQRPDWGFICSCFSFYDYNSFFFPLLAPPFIYTCSVSLFNCVYYIFVCRFHSVARFCIVWEQNAKLWNVLSDDWCCDGREKGPYRAHRRPFCSLSLFFFFLSFLNSEYLFSASIGRFFFFLYIFLFVMLI